MSDLVCASCAHDIDTHGDTLHCRLYACSCEAFTTSKTPRQLRGLARNARDMYRNVIDPGVANRYRARFAKIGLVLHKQGYELGVER